MENSNPDLYDFKVYVLYTVLLPESTLDAIDLNEGVNS